MIKIKPNWQSGWWIWSYKVDSIVDHNNEFQSLENQLYVVDLKLGNKEQTLLLLSSFSNNQETLVVTFNNLAPSGKLTMYKVKNVLFNEKAK